MCVIEATLKSLHMDIVNSCAEIESKRIKLFGEDEKHVKIKEHLGKATKLIDKLL